MILRSLILLSVVSFVCSTEAEAAVDARDFGAKGDGVSDDTAAIRKALAASKEVHFPAGVYVISDGIELPPSAIITGEGSPLLGTFPLRDDDKRYLNRDTIGEMPGTTLLFRGAGRARQASGRSDAFSELRYAIKTAAGLPYQIAGLAIVLDMQTRAKNGKATTPDSDERADFEVGLLVDDSPGGSLRDVNVFGYWKKAGLCVLSRGEGSNPDYNRFWNCSFSGDYGVALLGSDSDEAVGPGLSGTQFYGCNLFSADHHSRKGGQWGSGALFIDGATPGKRADINGHYFFGGCVRTYNNVAVRLGKASNVAFHSVVFEVPGWDGDQAQGADKTGRVVGTADTRDVMFFGCRMHDIGLGELAEAMTDGSVAVVGGLSEGISLQSGKQGVRLHAPAGGDPLLQLSRDLSSINSGWTMRMDVSEGDSLALRYNNRQALRIDPEGTLAPRRLNAKSLALGGATAARIEGGRVEVVASRMLLRAEDDAILNELVGGEEGEIVVLEAERAGLIAATDAAGNLRVQPPFVFASADARLVLMKAGDGWVEISRSPAGK